MKKMSGADTAWLRMEHPTNLMMISAILVLDGPVEYARLRRVLENRLLRFRRFRQRIVEKKGPFGRAGWEDDPRFDMGWHLKRLRLPEPGTEAQFKAVVDELVSTPLDFARPLWQFHLVENVEGGSAVVCRLHHCIADGIALIRVLLSFTDETPEGGPEGSALEQTNGASEHLEPSPPATRPRRNLLAKTWEAGKNLAADPARLAEAAKMGARVAKSLGTLIARRRDPPTALRGRLGVAKRCAWSGPVALADVKAIGRAAGGTVNDVLLTAVTGALRRYLAGRGEDVPADLNIRAAVPVNLRPPGAPLSMGNFFGLFFLSLPIGLESPAARLRELKRRMDAMKESPEAVVVLGILEVAGRTSHLIEEGLVRFLARKITAVATNVPGPREERYLAGAALRYAIPWVPQAGRVGLGISIISYAGEVRLGIAADAGLVPDPAAIIEHFHAEFEEVMRGVPAAHVKRCQAETLAGRQCRNPASEHARFCHVHEGREGERERGREEADSRTADR